MSRSVMLSIKPKWCELIESGKKTIEIRKTRPKIEPPFKCYIYQTKAPVSVSFSGTGKHISEYDKTYWYTGKQGNVIGEFICDEIIEDNRGEFAIEFSILGCMPLDQQKKYAPKATLYGWHISDLVIYDKPKDLDDFYRFRKCDACERGDESNACIYDDKCIVPAKLERAPQSWCYVDE